MNNEMDKNPTDEHGKRVFQLTINGKLYEWNQPIITGTEIRRLANIPVEENIFQEDKILKKNILLSDDKKVSLASNEVESFYSSGKDHNYSLIVNGRPKSWTEREITFEQIVILAFGNYDANPNKVYTVTYDRGPHQNPEGSMVKGNKVLVKNKMIFNVTCTDKS